MARSFVRCAAVVVPLSLAVLAGLAAEVQAADSYPPGTSTARAAKLVKQALDAGLAGDAALRSRLLAEAVAADGDYAPARWQSGQINFEGVWRTPDEVGEVVSADERWRRYREFREEMSGTLADHVALAKWCLRNGLTGEERYHWSNVLLGAPNHKQARQRLGVREYRGGLFTEEQVAEHERQLKDGAANLKKYKPRFIELVRQVRGESPSAREAALAKIRAVSDPGAIQALEAAIGRSKRDESDPRTRALNLAMVAALSNMREHDATLYLLNYAIFSQSEEVRQLAAEGLKSRATTDYVPLLMAALTAPIEAEFDVVAAPDGTVRMIETLRQSGPEADIEHVQSVNLEVDGVFGRDPTKTDPNAVLGGHLGRVRAKAENTSQRVQSYNAAATERNARIQETLKIATAMDLGSDPEDYWKAWGAENELQYSEDPVYEVYDEYTDTYSYEQAPSYPVTQGDMRAPPTTAACECFAPGTLVWTQSGPLPIEQIGVGDMVLAQNPTTGELAYCPVLETTVGEPAPVLQLTIGGEAFVATRGHRFWVNGRGWQMAKELMPATAVHAIDHAMNVTAIEKAADVASHNLVVDEFHTFFVGKSRLLVHDKSCPAPTTAMIPGLTHAARTATSGSTR
jgi:hypothetical protein